MYSFQQFSDKIHSAVFIPDHDCYLYFDNLMGFGTIAFRQQTAGQRSTRGRSPSLGLALLGGLCCLLCRSLGLRLLIALIFFLGAAFVGGHHHEHGTAFHLRRDLDRGDIGQGGGDFLQVFERDLGVIHLATAELDRHTDFVSLQKPAAGIVHFETTVRFIGLGTQADFLDFDLGLRPFGLAFLLGALINELAIIDDTADRRIGVG